MSKYKIIEVVKKTDGEKQSLYNSDDRIEAIAKAKNDYGVAVKDDTTLSVYTLVIDNENGSKVDGYYWLGDSSENSDLIRPRVYTHNDYADDNVSPYDSERLAIGNFATKCASAMNNSSCSFALTIRLSSIGTIADFDLFKRETKATEEVT